MKIKTFFSRLTRIGKKEPLHRFSLAIIIALDIFVLINLFQGLDMQKEQLDTPQDIIPYTCENFLIPKDSTQDQKISIIEYAINHHTYFDTVNNKYTSAAKIIEKQNKEKVDVQCKEIYEEALKIYSNKQLSSLISQIENYQSEIDILENENSRYKNEYDTMLLEKIANQPENVSLTNESANTVKQKIESNTNHIEKLNTKIDQAKDAILQNPNAQKFLNVIRERQRGIEKTRSTLEFWYPIKRVFSQMIFLLPLFFIFLWIYKKMIERENSILSLIASHLLLITLIPIVFVLFEFLLEILPFHILSDILNLLEALHIISLFSYILIIIGILLGIGVIYVLQKKIFSSHKIWEKRIQDKKCWNCGYTKTSEKEKFCSFCGEIQMEKCLQCGEEKVCKTTYCNNCGTSQNLQE